MFSKSSLTQHLLPVPILTLQGNCNIFIIHNEMIYSLFIIKVHKRCLYLLPSEDFTFFLWTSSSFSGLHHHSLVFTFNLWTSPSFSGLHLHSLDFTFILLTSTSFCGLHLHSLDFTFILWIHHYLQSQTYQVKLVMSNISFSYTCFYNHSRFNINVK